MIKQTLFRLIFMNIFKK
jgi:hypothetical protein